MPYSYCLMRPGGGNYLKSVVDIYYDEYMSGGWRFIDTTAADAWIRNSVSKDGRLLSINIIEKGGNTFLSVFDVTIAAEVEEDMQREAMSRKAGPLGATPGSGYVTLGQIKTMVSVSKSGNKLTLKQGKNVLEFTLGGRTAKLNGNPAKLNATPFFMDGATYFPVASLPLLGCTSDASGYLSIRCENRTLIADMYTFATKNAAATALQGAEFARNTTAMGGLPASVPSGAKPASAVAGVPYVAVDSLSSLGSVAHMADDSVLVQVGGLNISFAENTRRTAEGFNLPAAPFVFDGVLLVPLKSLEQVGCKVTVKPNLDYAIDCSNGSSTDGVVFQW